MHKSHLKISHTRTQQTHQVGKFNKENFVLHLQWSMISWSWSSFSMSVRKFKTKFLCAEDVWPFPSCNNFLFSPKFFPSKTFLLLFDAASLSGFNCFVSSHFVYPLHYNPLSKPLRKFSVCKEFFAPRTFHCWPNSIFVLKRNFQSLMLKFSREVEPFMVIALAGENLELKNENLCPLRVWVTNSQRFSEAKKEIEKNFLVRERKCGKFDSENLLA